MLFITLGVFTFAGGLPHPGWSVLVGVLSFDILNIGLGVYAMHRSNETVRKQEPARMGFKKD